MWTRMPVSRPRTGLARGSWLRTCPLSTAAGDVDGLPGGNSVAWMCWSTMPAGGPAGLLPPRTPHTRCASGSQPGGVMLVHPARSRSDGTRGAIVNMALTPVSASARTARQTSWWPKVGVIRLAGCFASSRPAAHGCRKPDRSASRRSGVSRVVRGSLASAMWRVVHRDVLAQFPTPDRQRAVRERGGSAWPPDRPEPAPGGLALARWKTATAAPKRGARGGDAGSVARMSSPPGLAPGRRRR